MDFPLPPVGEGLIEVELVRWLVRPGDAIARGQGLAEVMSDKASMEVPSPFAGTITALTATPGTKVQVGQVILSYNAVGEGVISASPGRQLQGSSTASGGIARPRCEARRVPVGYGQDGGLRPG